MSKEFTKIAYRNCQDCGKRISILCNESCQIVAIRCPECLRDFLISTMEIEQLRSYLKKKGWIELEGGRDEIIRVESPKGYRTWIPARNDLIDYKHAARLTLESIAVYEGLDFDMLLEEILKEERN